MLEASRFFEHVNSKPLDDPRVKVVLDDGRHYVETTRTKYDVIISEPSNPWLTGVANLFTREYFAAAHRALTPGRAAGHLVPAVRDRPRGAALDPVGAVGGVPARLRARARPQRARPDAARDAAAAHSRRPAALGVAAPRGAVGPVPGRHALDRGAVEPAAADARRHRGAGRRRRARRTATTTCSSSSARRGSCTPTTSRPSGEGPSAQAWQSIDAVPSSTRHAARAGARPARRSARRASSRSRR